MAPSFATFLAVINIFESIKFDQLLFAFAASHSRRQSVVRSEIASRIFCIAAASSLLFATCSVDQMLGTLAD